jgi:hypothetical protein
MKICVLVTCLSISCASALPHSEYYGRHHLHCDDFTKNADGSWSSRGAFEVGSNRIGPIEWIKQGSININGIDVYSLIEEQCGTSKT